MIPCDRLIISDSLLPFHNRYIKVNVAPQKGRPDVPIWQICRSKFESAWKLWNRPSSQQGNNFLHEKYGRRRYWRYSLEIWPGRHFCAEFIQFWTCWMGRDAGYVLHLKTNLIQHLQNLRDICKSLCLQIGVLLYNFIFELVYLWASVCVCVTGQATDWGLTDLAGASIPDCPKQPFSLPTFLSFFIFF